jgi:hypothetical protein
MGVQDRTEQDVLDDTGVQDDWLATPSPADANPEQALLPNIVRRLEQTPERLSWHTQQARSTDAPQVPARALVKPWTHAPGSQYPAAPGAPAILLIGERNR